ncbi:MAG: IS701 family transposase, partial [Rhodanobacteraceae bacterium]
MRTSLESRFEGYCDLMVAALDHADREGPARLYLKGLLLPGTRKSVEPMAARVSPERVRSVHQSMHHLVAQASWSDAALLARVARVVLPKLVRAGEVVHWIIDDTGIPKQGKHSVGVAHQFCSRTGRQDNCQVAASLSISTRRGSLPVGYRLYLPREWSADGARREHVGVPAGIAFATKPVLALREIRAALQAGYPHGTVLADVACGDDARWREAVAGLGLRYAVGVSSGTTVWVGGQRPVPAPPGKPRGRSRRRAVRGRTHRSVAVATVARALPARSWRTLTWREGTAAPRSSRFARIRVRAAPADQPRAEAWLIIEWPAAAGAPARYWLSNLPKTTRWRSLVDTVMGGWRIERDHRELKQELG